MPRITLQRLIAQNRDLAERLIEVIERNEKLVEIANQAVALATEGIELQKRNPLGSLPPSDFFPNTFPRFSRD